MDHSTPSTESTPHRLWRQSCEAIAGGPQQRAAAASTPVADYLGSAGLAREQNALRALPYPAALGVSLARPGDWASVSVHGVPVLLSRGADLRVRAHVAVCRHRGALLCAPGTRGEGRARVVCPYHAWTYDTDSGACVGRPHEADFAHLPREQAGLVALPCHERLGIVWVIASASGTAAEAAFDWDGWFGPLGAELEGLGYGPGAFAPHERQFVSAANWKLVLEGNLESYHFQYAHRQTIAHLFHDNLVVHEQLGDHQRIVLPKRSMAQWQSQHGALPADAAAMADLLGRHSHIIYYLFPATFALWEGDHINLFSVSPLDTDHCDVRGWLLVPGHLQGRRSAEHWQRNHDLFWAALDEDFALAESIQSGLRSGANTHLQFGANEFACANFRASLRQVVQAQTGAG